MREIGVLFIVFAPLDGAFSSGPRGRPLALLFLCLGLLFFCGALILERRRRRGP
jgi:hypothetical protein